MGRMTLKASSLGDLWPKVRPLWGGLDRVTRFALLDVLMHVLMRGEGFFSVERLAALLGRDPAVLAQAVNRLVSLGVLEEGGQALGQRFVALNHQSEWMNWVVRLMELLSSAREAREQFLRTLADDQTLLAFQPV